MLPVLLTDSVTPDLDRALHYTTLWGLEGVVLRTVGSAAERVPNVHEAKLRRRLEANDLPCVALDPGLFEGALADRAAWMNEVAYLAEVAAFSARLGCPRIVVGNLAAGGAEDAARWREAMQRAGDIAAHRGLTLVIRNDAETALMRGLDLAERVRDLAHPAVAMAWLPVESYEAGAAVGEEVATVASVAGLVYVRDGTRSDGVRTPASAGDDVQTSDAWQEAIPGDGVIGWPRLLEGLHQGGFDGPVCLDVRFRPPGRDGLRAATALLRMIRAATRPSASSF